MVLTGFFFKLAVLHSEMVRHNKEMFIPTYQQVLCDFRKGPYPTGDSDEERNTRIMWMTYVTEILPCVSLPWKKRKLRAEKLVSEKLTVTDEAFVAQLLFVYRDRYIEEGKERPPPGALPGKQKKQGHKKNMTVPGSNEGLQKYVKAFKMITEQRAQQHGIEWEQEVVNKEKDNLSTERHLQEAKQKEALMKMAEDAGNLLDEEECGPKATKHPAEDLAFLPVDAVNWLGPGTATQVSDLTEALEHGDTGKGQSDRNLQEDKDPEAMHCSGDVQEDPQAMNYSDDEAEGEDTQAHGSVSSRKHANPDESVEQEEEEDEEQDNGIHNPRQMKTSQRVLERREEERSKRKCRREQDNEQQQQQ